MDLALWTFLGIPLAVLYDTGPASKQLVSFSVVATLDPVVPWRVAFEAPHKLAIATLDLVLVLGAAGVVALQRGEVTALGAGFGAGVQLTQLQKVTILCHVLAG